ncbi:uncharacterized protein [Palaemon carinicauda]|uniref:uncharacterized protein n=1 Tax=Palaemon carinicauda TaxID=392227 RepID=UPI0035B67506
MFVLLFACCGMFHLAAGSGHCEKREGILESDKNNKITFDLPDLHETVIGFQLKSHGNTLISITISGPLKNNTQPFYYNYDQDKWRFIRITESEYRMPQERTINLKRAGISSPGRKFIASSSERVCWQMFLPNNNVAIPENEEPPPTPTPTERVNPTTDLHQETPNFTTSESTSIFLAIVCGLMALLVTGLGCYTCRLKRLFKRTNGGKVKTIHSEIPSILPDLFGRRNISGSTTTRQNNFHNTENVIYNLPIR